MTRGSQELKITVKRRQLRAVALLAAAAVASAVLAGCTAPSQAGGGTSFLTISRETGATFVRNFNPFSPNNLPITNEAIYEPLFVYNDAGGNTVPWLATKWTQAADAMSSTFQIRSGVKWSDGKPLTAADVAYTINLDHKTTGAYSYLKSATASGSTVTVTYTEAYSPALYELGGTDILPEHIWSKISDPSKYTNPNPVGTGPYTKVSNFQGQSFDLLKNPHYWQASKLKVDGIRMLAYAGNQAAATATVNGDITWSPQYIPDIQKVFVDKAPKTRGFWYPTTSNTIQFTLNTTEAPFNDVNVRKAMSMAINRKDVVDFGESGYTKPADCTGLSDNVKSWKVQSIVDSCTWTKYDVAAANKLLDSAGYPKGSNGKRTLKNGKPFSFAITVNATSNDWVTAAQVVSKDLAAVGITASVKTVDSNLLVQDVMTANFQTAIAWSGLGPTPYSYYRSQFSLELLNKSTNSTPENFGRFTDPQAEALLKQFAATSDATKQHQISDQLQARFNELAPQIPLFPSNVWGTYNASTYVGWPSESNPYADLNPFTPTSVLVLTHLTKRG
jgi:peptide/nickel transport system substrate-binding protein